MYENTVYLLTCVHSSYQHVNRPISVLVIIVVYCRLVVYMQGVVASIRAMSDKTVSSPV